MKRRRISADTTVYPASRRHAFPDRAVRRFFTIPLLAFLLVSTGNSRTVTQMNGFVLDNAAVPTDEIFHGGPPRDGIPALTRPEMIPADKAGFLGKKDVVMGIYYRGIARAYPNRIMVWHEIVNDNFNGTPVVVSFCPLCNTGIAFLAETDGKTLEFGVSGLLYNSDMLMYDRQSESLWAQIPGKAISGPYRGRQLTPVPVVHTTWEAWQAEYPQTRVLSPDTGYQRDYLAGNPYGDYDESRTLFFPVASRDDRYHPKENVLGLHAEGKARVWPFQELEKTSGEIEDEFDGQPVRIVYDKDNKSARAYNMQGELLPAVTAFWFAWYTFFPYTEIYKAP